MANKTYAKEWLEKSLHDLEGANVLDRADHYTDTIGYLIHQSLEKMIKAIPAYHNLPIQKTHNLVELYELFSDHMELTVNEIYFLSIATTYHIKQRYPVMHKTPPSKEEITEILIFANKLFEKICQTLDISENEIH